MILSLPGIRERRFRLSVPAIAAVLAAGLLLRLLLAYVLLPGEGLVGDLRLFTGWALTLEAHGPGGFYSNAGFADYLPGYLWVLWPLGEIGTWVAGLTGQEPAEVIASLVKLPAILADIVIAGLLYRAASAWHDRRAGLVVASLFLFLPVSWYDSAVWGQVDAIGALLLLGSILLLIAGWSEPAVAVAVFAALTKPQYAIGLVVVGAILLRRHLVRRGSGPVLAPGPLLAGLDRCLGGWFTQQQGLRRLASSGLVGLTVGAVTILPFDLATQGPVQYWGTPVLGSIAGLAAVIGSAASFYAVLTANAFNIWAPVGPAPLSQALNGDYPWTFDSLPVLGSLQAVTVGAALFVVVALVVVAALLVRDDRRTILLGFTVLAVAFFVLPTRVHERYLFPAFGVGALLAITSAGWRWWYAALALANVANLHAILTMPRPGYGTPGVAALPLGDLLRSQVAVTAVAFVHALLFAIVLVALVREAPRPIGRLRALVDRGGRVTLPRLQGPARVSISTQEARDMATTPSVPVLAQAAAGVGGAVAALRDWVAVIASPIRHRLDSGGAPKDLTTAIAREGVGQIVRRDLFIALAIVAVTFGMRTFRLDTPASMYFDESFYPQTAMEFLQDWRYGIPHDLRETTHPPISKYIIAGGIALFGNNQVIATDRTGRPVRDVAFQPAFQDSSGPNGLGGDRLAVVTADGVRLVHHGDLASAVFVALRGAAAAAFDAGDRLVVGTDDGRIWLLDSAALAVTDSGTVPTAVRLFDLGAAVRHVWAAGDDRIAIATADGRLTVLSLSFGSIVASRMVPGVTSLAPLGVSGRRLAVATVTSGLLELDLQSLEIVAEVALPVPPGNLVFVDGSEFLRRNRAMLATPTLYVPVGSALQTVTVAADGALEASTTMPMPGPVTEARWDRPTNTVHVLGTSPGGKPTIYVVMPLGNVVFADAELPFKPAAWTLDVQPNEPRLDRQRALAFSATGDVAVVDVGSNAFAWRIFGVLAGSLMAGLLYLLARLLFRRPIVGYLLAMILAIDGLLFAQARIAMNDSYLAFFIVAALTLLAWLMAGRRTRWPERLATIAGLPLVGILLGLALGTKWVGAYAMGAAVLLVLLHSPIGRRIALAGMVALSAVLGWQALAQTPANLVFPALMFGLILLTGAAIVRVEQNPHPAAGAGHAAEGRGPSWLDPRRGFGIPFGWALACLTVLPIAVYIVGYVPWALSAGGSPQLVPGWPVGHTGQTFLDLQNEMYRYHNELRVPHGSSSPWWAWPLGLKPIWGHFDTFLDGTSGIMMAVGNPVLLWLAIPAVAFGAWQAWKRRSGGLLFVLVAFLALWLPWSRIDRVAFNYHYYTALPFAFILLAYFLAELWDGPSRRTWNLARLSFAGVLLAPAVLWALRDGLCAIAGVASRDPATFACTRPLSDVALPVLAWLVAALVAGWFILGARRPRRLVAVILGTAGLAFMALYPGIAGMRLPRDWALAFQGLLPSWDTSFLFSSNTAPYSPVPLLGLGPLILLVLTAAAVRWVMGGRDRTDLPRVP